MYILNGILFLFKFLFILSSEFISYKLTYANYENFIERLALRLSSVNILCVKIIQAISSNNSLISESLNNKLLQYTDNAPWSKEDIDYNKLHQIIDKYDFELNE